MIRDIEWKNTSCLDCVVGIEQAVYDSAKLGTVAVYTEYKDVARSFCPAPSASSPVESPSSTGRQYLLRLIFFDAPTTGGGCWC